MKDNFALLNVPREPWIDADALKNKFLTLSSIVHPDRVHQAPEAERKAADEHYAELNAAYNCLREPKERLRHLLELELGKKTANVENISTDMMETFFEISQACKSADTFLAEKAKVSSPILKVQLFERGQEWVDTLNSLQRKTNERREELFTELKQMNPAWQSRHSELPLPRLEEIHRLLGYFARWSEQIQERIVQLAL